MAFAADGKTLVSGSQDKNLMLWDVATGTRQAILEGHGFPVIQVAISPDGKTVASASWPQVPAKVWDVATRRQRFEVPGRTVTFSADGTLATTGWSGVKLWDAATGKERGRSPASDEIGEVVGISAFSPDGKTMVFVSFTRTVWLWDVLRGELRARLGRQGPIQAVALSPDGRSLAVASKDGPPEVWERAPAEETISLAHGGGGDRDLCLLARPQDAGLGRCERGEVLGPGHGRSVGGRGVQPRPVRSRQALFHQARLDGARRCPGVLAGRHASGRPRREEPSSSLTPPRTGRSGRWSATTNPSTWSPLAGMESSSPRSRPTARNAGTSPPGR